MAQANFVKVKGHQFILNGKPWYYIGTNYWYGGLLSLIDNNSKGKKRLKKELDFLAANGVNNLRVLVGAEGSGQINGVQRVQPALQTKQGIFNAAVLTGLDYLLTEMHKRKMYAVLYLSNNWEWSGGFLQYINWNGLIADSVLKRKLTWDEQRDYTSQFHNCLPCKNAYEKQLRFVLSHINIYSKIKYINEPAIMSWEIANEPRAMRPNAIAAYKEWLSSTSMLIKSLDKNHLVTIGSEGYMGAEGSLGLYKDIHSAKAIDYLTIHIWPKNWGWFQDTNINRSLDDVISKSKKYIAAHEVIAAELQKPLVLEEFGLPRDRQSFANGTSTVSRDAYYKQIFAEVQRSVASNGVIAGANFWAFGGTARSIPNQVFWKNGDDFMGDPPQEEQGLNAVFDNDMSTWDIINVFVKAFNK